MGSSSHSFSKRKKFRARNKFIVKLSLFSKLIIRRNLIFLIDNLDSSLVDQFHGPSFFVAGPDVYDPRLVRGCKLPLSRVPSHRRHARVMPAQIEVKAAVISLKCTLIRYNVSKEDWRCFWSCFYTSSSPNDLSLCWKMI